MTITCVSYNITNKFFQRSLALDSLVNSGRLLSHHELHEEINLSFMYAYIFFGIGYSSITSYMYCTDEISLPAVAPREILPEVIIII